MVNGSDAGNFAKCFQHRFDFGLRIEWQRGLMLAVSAGPCVLGIFFLQMRGIGKQNIAQLDRRGVRVDRAAEAVADQARQIARMVQVRVRQHAPVERGRLFGERCPNCEDEVPSALETGRNPPATACLPLR